MQSKKNSLMMENNITLEDNRYKLTDPDIKRMREMKASGFTCAELSVLFKVRADYISNVCRGVYREEAGGPIGKNLGIKSVDEKIVIEIRNKRAKRIKVKDLAKEYELSPKQITLICRGYTHKKVKGKRTGNEVNKQFSKNKILTMRTLFDKGEKTCTELAAKYRVTYGYMRLILKGEAYKDYPGPVHPIFKRKRKISL